MLTSQLFAGDDLLQRISDGGPERISRFQNSTAPAVLKVQQALLIWDAAALPLHGADGNFGAETEQALRQFQQKSGLAASGAADAETLAALRLLNG